MLHVIALATAVAADSDEGTSPAPITIRSCSTGITASNMLYKTDGNYRIEFVNDDSREVAAVGFVVHLGAQDIFIKDEGTFSPGADVIHRFLNRGGDVATTANPAMSCDVRWVRFTDGTEWDSP